MEAGNLIRALTQQSPGCSEAARGGKQAGAGAEQAVALPPRVMRWGPRPPGGSPAGQPRPRRRGRGVGRWKGGEGAGRVRSAASGARRQLPSARRSGRTR